MDPAVGDDHVEHRGIRDGIGPGKDPHGAGAHVDRVGLLVVDPVGDVLDVRLGEEIEGIVRLGQCRPESALGRRTGVLGDDADDIGDHAALLVLGHARVHDGVGHAVTHPLPTQSIALLDYAGLAEAHFGVEGHGAGHAMLFHASMMRQMPTRLP